MARACVRPAPLLSFIRLISILLFSWALGCVVYSIYSAAVLRGDTAARIAAFLMGLGGLGFLLGPRGLVLLSMGAMLVGTLMSLNLFPTSWLVGEIKANPEPVDESAPAAEAAASAAPSASPLLGGAMMLAALPILGLSSLGFWAQMGSLVVCLLRATSLTLEPADFLSSVAIAGVGGGLYYAGYGKSGLKRASLGARAAAIGVGLLAFGWTGLLIVFGSLWQRHLPDKTPAPAGAPTLAATAPPAPGVLTSVDGRLTIAMPSCWKAESRPGRALYATCGAAALSISESPYGPYTSDGLQIRVEKSEKTARDGGAVIEDPTQVRVLKRNQPLVFFRFRSGNDRLYEGEFTLWSRSYTLFWKNLGPEDAAALDKSLVALAAASAPSP